MARDILWISQLTRFKVNAPHRQEHSPVSPAMCNPPSIGGNLVSTCRCWLHPAAPEMCTIEYLTIPLCACECGYVFPIMYRDDLLSGPLKFARLSRSAAAVMVPDPLSNPLKQFVNALDKKLSAECARLQSAIPPTCRALVATLTTEVRPHGVMGSLSY